MTIVLKNIFLNIVNQLITPSQLLTIFICGCFLQYIPKTKKAMLDNIFPDILSNHICNTSKESVCISNLQTAITNQTENITLHMISSDQAINEYDSKQNTPSIDNLAQINYRQGRECFQNSLCFKLNQLQSKSSKILSKLPNIHNKILRAQPYSRNPLQIPYLSTSTSMYGNKLKIIRDLGQKIEQLQTNINNPLTCHEDMLNIEKQINLNFENYYQQIKQNDAIETHNDESICSQDSSSESIKDKLQCREKCMQTSSIIKDNIYEENITIAVFVPKIIEIQVPYQIYIPKEICKQNIHQFSFDSEALLINSHLNHNISKQINQISISKIINQYHDKIYNSQSECQIVECGKTNQKDQIDNCEFHLPLDSYERCQSEKAVKQNYINTLRKTDRSNISSNQQLQNLRNDIWNKDEIGFNQEHLSLVKQNQHKSQNSSQDNFVVMESEERQRTIIVLNNKISTLTVENNELKNNIKEIDLHRNELIEQIRALESRAIEIEIQYLQQIEKIDELVQQNNEINLEIIKYKQLLFKEETTKHELQGKIKNITDQFNITFEEKQTQIHNLCKNMAQKIEQIDEYTRLNEEINKAFQKKQENYKYHIAELQSSLSELKEQVIFYKSKLEEQGINLKLEEATILRDLIQKNEQDEWQKLMVLQKKLQNKYKTKLNELKSDKDILQHEVEELRKIKSHALLNQFSSGNKDQAKHYLHNQIRQLLSSYNIQLFKKDQEIVQLQKISSNYREQLNLGSFTSEEQLKTITSIKDILIKEKMDKENISNNMVQFVYVIDKLLRSIKVYEYAAHRQKQERIKLTKKITSINLFYNRQLEKSEENNLKLQNESKKLKQQLIDSCREMKKLGNKLQMYRSKLEIPNSQLYTVLELQNQYLVLESKKINKKFQKLKQYCKQLQEKLLSDFMKSGNSICEHTCSKQQVKQQISRQEVQFSKKIENIMIEMKDQYNKSVIFINPQNSIIEKSKIKSFKINSSVISVTNSPKPLKQSNNPKIKALFAPLPELPQSSPTPSTSITLDKLLLKNICTSQVYRTKVIVKLFQFGLQLVKISKKLFSLKPCQILVNYSNEQVEIKLRRQIGNQMEDDENLLIYRAPEVLLGFTEAQSSYAWTIGLIIDQILHGKLFYRKINQILSHKNNYYVRNEEISIKALLERMLRKNHKERPSLTKCRQEFYLLQA